MTNTPKSPLDEKFSSSYDPRFEEYSTRARGIGSSILKRKSFDECNGNEREEHQLAKMMLRKDLGIRPLYSAVRKEFLSRH